MSSECTRAFLFCAIIFPSLSTAAIMKIDKSILLDAVASMPADHEAARRQEWAAKPADNSSPASSRQGKARRSPFKSARHPSQGKHTTYNANVTSEDSPVMHPLSCFHMPVWHPYCRSTHWCWYCSLSTVICVCHCLSA